VDESEVSTSHLRAELARYLRRAAEGQPVTVLRHGRPDVDIVPHVEETTDPKTDQNEPWQVVGEPGPAGFYDEPPEWLQPGLMVRWQREDAAVRAEELRKESERQDRADARQQAAMWAARSNAAARGLPWNPSRPFEYEPTVYDKAEHDFALMDAKARADDFRAAKEAGLIHLLHQSPARATEPPSSPEAAPAGAAAARARIKAVLKSWSKPKVPRDPHPLACNEDDRNRPWREVTR